MSFLTSQEKQTIRKAIAEVESETTGEIVTVLANQSDSYLYIPTLWAALIALAIPGFSFLFDAPFSSTFTYQIQVMTFLTASVTFQIQGVKMLLIPKRIKHYRASMVAREQFIVQGLHTTQNRTGILIFVSKAEHYVEIIADKGIHEKIEPHFWQDVIDEFSQLVQQNRTCDGFIAAISHCKKTLQTHFPIENQHNPDELPNHLIEI